MRGNPVLTRRTLLALAATLAVSPACARHADTSPEPEPSASGPFIWTGAITDKTHYQPGPDWPLDERWEFQFDTGGGWTRVPVSQSDFDRYAVGDSVTVRHVPGELAQITT